MGFTTPISEKPHEFSGPTVDGRLRPVPRQEIIKPVYGMAVGHALEHVFEVTCNKGEASDLLMSALCMAHKPYSIYRMP